MSEHVFLQGKSMWSRTLRPDEWGNWSIQLIPNAKSLEIIKKMQSEGLKNRIRETPEGPGITFRRPQQKMLRGKVVGLTPPEVVDKDGNPCEVQIGNGSDVTLKLETYLHNTPGGSKARAARLLGVRIDSLVPFEKEDYDEDRREQIEGLAEQPPQLF